MHGRRQGGGEGCGKRRRLVRHMWPVFGVEVAPPAPAPPPSPVPPPPTPPPPAAAPATTPAAAEAAAAPQQHDSAQPAVPDSFVKDGREIRVGDCALFRAVNAPPFIGLIRWIEKNKEGYPKLRVSWLYRPADIKLNKGIQLNAAPNEVFYSFHQDETSAVSLLHPCKVSFLRKGSELPVGISSFVCWRVYDIDNKCLWWLTDQDYINERQEEVNRLLDRTRLEMHAAVQSGGRSPKRLNGPSSAQQLKSGSDGAQNCGASFPAQSKGKKRDRGEQGIEPAKRERDRPVKVEDGDSGNFKFDNMKAEIAKITEKGGLANAEAVEKLVHLMQLNRTERKIDFAGRVMLADIIAATEKDDCLGRFVQLRGLPVLDDWLQEAHKGKSGDGSSPKENDKPVEELLLALLRALAKLPINLTALQSCNIGKSVNHLRSHKNLEIQKKARALVDTWKKRVDAEMKTNDAKPVVSGQAVSWPGKTGFPEVSNPGNRRSGSSEPSLKNPASHLPASKTLAAKPGPADAIVKSNPGASGSSKLQQTPPATLATSSKDPPCKSSGGTGGSELPTVKEEKSSSSSQSQNNSQSCSSDHAKTIGSSWKEDARSSTAGSVNATKTSGSSSRHRRSSNGLLGSGVQKEAAVGRSGSLDRSSVLEKTLQSGMTCEKAVDTPSDHGNSHRLIVRFPNPGRSPARSASGGSFEDPSVTGSRASSPVPADKHEHNDRKVKVKTEGSRPHLPLDANTESWQSNDVKGAAGSDEGDRSPCAALDDERSRTADEAGKATCASRVACSTSGNEKGVFSSEARARNSFSSINALIESCVKYSEASPSLQVGDDTGMNLLASVAGEISKSELISPSASPKSSSAIEEGCEGDNIGKSKVPCDVGVAQRHAPLEEVENAISEKQEKSDAYLAVKEEPQQRAANVPSETNLLLQDNKGTVSTEPSPLSSIEPHKTAESSVKTENHEDDHTNKCFPTSAPVDMECDDDEKPNACWPADNNIDNKSIVSPSANEDRRMCTAREKIEDGCTGTSDVVCNSLGDQCSVVVLNKKAEKLAAEESSLCVTDKQAQGTVTSTDQKQHVGVSDHSEAVDRCGDVAAGKLDSKSSCPAEAVELKRTDSLGVSNTVLKEDEKKGQSSPTRAGITKLVGSAVSRLGAANGTNEIKETKDSSSESSSHVKPQGVIAQETEHSAKHTSSKKSSDDADGKEELVLSDEGSSLAAKAESNTAAKLDFDLNEGIPGDDGHQCEPATSAAVICSSAIHLPGLSPFMSPISSGLPTPITVAAPAKGPFVPPENLLRVKSETGWKGSAATSAFRPAEPRKALEMPLSSPDIPVSDAAGKQSRPALDIDLNVADDRVLEEEVSQSSAQTTGSESGNTRSRDGPVRSAGLELDLNRADEGAETGQFMSGASHRFEVPLLPARPLSGVFSNADANSSRDFDLNNGPSLDEVATEPAPRSQVPKNTNSVPFLPPVAGVRMNSAEMGNMSSWFPSANSYPAVAIPSFLSDRGEQPYPFVAAPGTQRIIGSVAGGGPFASDNYRAPVLSSSPAMAFSPAAYPYAGFPFSSSFPLPSAAFSVGSTPYADSASPGASCFPAIPSQLVGPAGTVSSHFPRPYVINLPEGGSSGHDSSRKWGRQGFDLNSGPGSVDVEGKDERVPSAARQNLVTPSQAFVEEQARIYQVPGVGIKRKEPEGGWDAERSAYKQLSWQ